MSKSVNKLWLGGLISAAGLEDLKATPLSGAVRGVMIHASLAGNLLNHELLHRSSVTTVVWITLVMTLITCAMVLGFKRMVWKLVAPVLLATAYIWLCFFFFSVQLCDGDGAGIGGDSAHCYHQLRLSALQRGA